MFTRYLVLLVLVVTLGCGAEPEATVLDLVAGLPLADVRSEVTSIRLGRPETRWHLGSGWAAEGFDRRWGSTYVSSRAPEATLSIQASSAGPATFRLSGRSRSDLSGVGATFELLLNGKSLGRRTVKGKTLFFRFRARGAGLRLGANEMTLRWHVPAASGVVPHVRWGKVTIDRDDTLDAELPRRMADRTSILIPTGNQVDYYFELPEGGLLAIDEISFVGGGAGRFEVRLYEDGAETVSLASFDGSAEKVRVDLGRFAGQVVRLSLEALSTEAQGAGITAVVLTAPRIQAPLTVPPAVSASSSGGSPQGNRNIILYVVDTLRADHLGIYGYPKPVSPRLDEFAAGATVFENAMGQSSWTRAAMASVHTGLWPLKHNANGRRDVLAPEAVTLAELLAERGYETRAIVSNHNVHKSFGFDQGFDRHMTLANGRASKVTAGVLEWLDGRSNSSPFLLWLQPVEPHWPYNPRGDLRERFAEPDLDMSVDQVPTRGTVTNLDGEERERAVRQLLALYDGEIATNDAAFGALLDGLEARGLLDETLIVFVSDHGEEFYDHGYWEHGKNLFAETLRVPLVIRVPGSGEGTRVTEVVDHVDLLPTMLDYAGVPIPEFVEGQSLIGLIDGTQKDDGAGTAFSYLDLDGRTYMGMVDGDWKLIQRMMDGNRTNSSLFQLSEDPGETRNRLLEHPVRARYMELRLAARQAEGAMLANSEAELDQETEDALRALGYLQ